MTKPSLGETLRKMASDHGSRSESARLREVYPDVERALKSGVSRKAVLEALHGDGFTMSLKMFDKALYRIRKSRAAEATPKPGHAQQVAESPTDTPKAISEQSKRPSLTPAALRDIRNREHDWVALSQPVKD